MRVYKGEQAFEDFLRLESQGMLFDARVTARKAALDRLTVLATNIVNELGRETDDSELREIIKRRAAGKIAYDAQNVSEALDAALRVRRR